MAMAEGSLGGKVKSVPKVSDTMLLFPFPLPFPVITCPPPSCGVLPADTVPGRLLPDLIGSGSPSRSAKAGGVVDSYSGDGCLGDRAPVTNVLGFGRYCKLALRTCALVGLLPTVGVRPSLRASLPSDMIERDLPCVLTGFNALFGPDGWIGALCGPPLTGAVTTFNDSVGRCPLVLPATEGVREVTCCTIDARLLCGTDAVALFTSRPPASPLGVSVSWSPPRCSPGTAEMFRNVMMHSMSSPAYTAASLQCTKARRFEAGAAGAIAVLSLVCRWFQAGATSLSLYTL